MDPNIAPADQKKKELYNIRKIIIIIIIIIIITTAYSPNSVYRTIKSSNLYTKTQ